MNRRGDIAILVSITLTALMISGALILGLILSKQVGLSRSIVNSEQSYYGAESTIESALHAVMVEGEYDKEINGEKIELVDGSEIDVSGIAASVGKNSVGLCAQATANYRSAERTVTLGSQFCEAEDLPPAITFTANPNTGLDQGDSTTLNWEVTGGVESCEASNGWSGGKSTNGGSEVQSNLQQSTTFTLSCTGPGGTTVESVYVEVNIPDAPVVDLSAVQTASTIYNATVQLTWVLSGGPATSCSASGNWSGNRSPTGGVAFEYPSRASTNYAYSIICTGPGGTSTDTALFGHVPVLPSTFTFGVNNPQGITNKSFHLASYLGYSYYWSSPGFVHFDSVTANWLCDLIGYQTVSFMDPNWGGRTGFSSPHDNTMFRYDPSVNNLVVRPARESNIWMSSLSCSNPKNIPKPPWFDYLNNL